MKLHSPSKKLLNRLTASVLAILLSAGAAMPTAFTANAAEQDKISAMTFTYPQEHTFEEINQYYIDNPFDVNMKDEYEIEPDMTNAEINAKLDGGEKLEDHPEYWNVLSGKLTDATLTNALNAANFIRYTAGVQEMYIHTAGSMGGRQWRAQAGAALLATLGIMVHDVPWDKASAAGISYGLYGWAKAGPSGSNCVAGNGIANKQINSFMPDVGNDGKGLSHRSYILNPGIAGTGFGAANIPGKGSAVTMFVTYGDNDPYGINAVMWPSQKQPIETFQARGKWQMSYPEGNPYQGNPWSFFFGVGNGNVGSVDTSKLKVTLECNGQTEVLEYSKLTETQLSENRLFTTNSSPLRKLIAWRPATAYNAGDKVHVTIEGIVGTDDLPVPVEYDVHFFETGTLPYPNLDEVSADRTGRNTAEVNFTADYDGTLYYLVQDADEAAPTAENIMNGTSVEFNANAATFNITSLADKEAKKLYYITVSESFTTGATVTDSVNSGEMSAVQVIDIPESTHTVTPGATKPEASKPQTYSVRVGSAKNGSVSVSDSKVVEGQSVTISVKPDDGYELSTLSVSGSDGNAVALNNSGDGRYTFTMPDCDVTVNVTFAKISSDTQTTPFEDVKQQDYFHDAVKWAAENEIVEGIKENHFGANSSCTRAQIAVFMWRMAGCPEPQEGTTDFLDINENDYYYKAVLWAAQNSITNGVNENEFAPNQAVTRAQVATLLYRSSGAEHSGEVSGFADVDENAYYFAAVAWAKENGITLGTGGDLFSPEANCTRAQMVTMLYRSVQD